MKFKNIDVEPGDIVEIQAKSVPLESVQVAVVNVINGVLEVISTLLVPFQHNGHFPPNDVIRIMVVYPAAIAIPQNSDGKFKINQRISMSLKNGENHQGVVIAAFDNIIIARDDNGNLMKSSSSYVKKIWSKALQMQGFFI